MVCSLSFSSDMIFLAWKENKRKNWKSKRSFKFRVREREKKLHQICRKLKTNEDGDWEEEMHLYNEWLPPPVAEETKKEKESFARVVRCIKELHRPDDPESVYATLKWISVIELWVLDFVVWLQKPRWIFFSCLVEIACFLSGFEDVF